MAVCGFCNQEMMSAKTTSCVKKSIEFPRGKKKKAQIPSSFRCGDCHVKVGGYLMGAWKNKGESKWENSRRLKIIRRQVSP